MECCVYCSIQRNNKVQVEKDTSHPTPAIPKKFNESSVVCNHIAFDHLRGFKTELTVRPENFRWKLYEIRISCSEWHYNLPL